MRSRRTRTTRHSRVGSAVSNPIQTLAGQWRILPELSHPLGGDSAQKNVGANGGMSCAIRNATALTRQIVCWQLRTHANLMIANFVSQWLSHGCRWLVGTRQWTVCTRAGARSRLTAVTKRRRFR
jgi:hypothetical protein